MKFSSYNPVVNPNTLQNVPIRGAMAPQRFAPLMGDSVQWKSFADMAKMGLSLHKDVVDGKTMEANAEYNKLMSERTSALLQRKEGEALNIVDDYDKLQKDVLGQVREKYGNYIGYGAGAEAFNAYTMKDDATRRDHMVKYQTAQTEKFQETQFNNQLATCQDFVISGGGTDNAIEVGFNRAAPLIESRFANYGQEKIDEQKRLVKGQLVASALQMAIGSNDYTRMGDIASKYNDFLDPKTRVSVLTMLGKRQQDAHNLAQAEDLWVMFGPNATREDIKNYVVNNMKNRDGIQTLFATAENLCGVEMDNGRNGCVEYVMKTLSTCSQFGLNNAAQRNVGNLYRAALNENSGATVLRYDGQKTQAGDILVYATPGDDISDPDNLEHVTIADGSGGYYGNSSGARDYVDESGNYVRGNGCGVHSDEQEIGGYEIAYIIRPDDLTAREMSALDIEEQTDKLWTQYEKKYQRQRTMENRLIEQGKLEQEKLILDNVTDPDAYDAIANQYSFVNGDVNDRVLTALRKQGWSLRNIAAKEAEREAARASGSGGNGGKKENDPMARIAIKQMLEAGIPSDEILEHIDQHNYSNAKDLVNMVFDYQKGTGSFSQKWGDLKSTAKAQFKGGNFDEIWPLAQDYAYQQYKEYVAEKHAEPTQKEMLGWLLEGFVHPEYITSGGMWDSTETSDITNAEWYNRGVDPSGVFYNPNTGKYSVTLTAGGTYEISPEQYDAIVKEGKRADLVVFGGY